MVGLLSVAGDLRGKEMFVACKTYVFFSNVPQRVCGEKKKAHMRSMVGLLLVNFAWLNFSSF